MQEAITSRPWCRARCRGWVICAGPPAVAVRRRLLQRRCTHTNRTCARLAAAQVSRTRRDECHRNHTLIVFTNGGFRRGNVFRESRSTVRKSGDKQHLNLCNLPQNDLHHTCVVVQLERCSKVHFLKLCRLNLEYHTHWGVNGCRFTKIGLAAGSSMNYTINTSLITYAVCPASRSNSQGLLH